MHVITDSCSNIGSYSIGGIYDGVWTKLTFNYPQPWKGTFATFNIDGNYYCTSEEPKDCTQMDNYTTFKPRADESGISTGWSLPDTEVRQTFTLSENRTIIKYTVKNTGATNHTAGVRIHLDTMLGFNDGAPIYIPGDGLKTTEKDYSGGNLNFGYFKAYNSPDNPTIVATGTIDPNSGMTYPNRVIVADWKQSKDTAWDYQIQSRVITGDSAVLLYYDLGVIEPGSEKSVLLSIGSEAPILRREQGKFGLTEIVENVITGEYCPGDEATFKVDVLSQGARNFGSVVLTVEGGGQVQYNNTIPAEFPQDAVKTVEFHWKVPNTEGNAVYDVKAFLYNESGVIGSKQKMNAVRVDAQACSMKPVIAVSGTIVGGFLFISAIFSFAIVLAIVLYILYNRGSVEFTKYIDGEHVLVTVTNNTRKTLKDTTIEDTIPHDAEVGVHTMHVTRKQTTLEFHIGDLRPTESATLDYRVHGGHASGESNVVWSRGSKAIK